MLVLNQRACHRENLPELFFCSSPSKYVVGQRSTENVVTEKLRDRIIGLGEAAILGDVPGSAQ